MSAPAVAPRRRRLPASDGDRFVYVLAIPVVLVLLFLVVIPMATTAFTSAGGNGLADNYGSLFGGSSGQALLLSLVSSLVSVFFCGVLGTLLAVLLHRFDFPGRRALSVFAVLPMALPPLIGAVSFVLLYSETGIVPRTLNALLGISPASTSVSGLAGVVLVHAFTMYPYFYLSVSAALAGLDGSLEEAATNLGAGRARVWRTVLLPMLTPALVSGALLTFMMSMASFTAPQLYNVQTLTMEIVSARTSGNAALAATQSTALSVVSIAFLMSMRWYQGRRVHRSLSKGTPSARRAPGSAAARLAAALGSLLLTVVLLAPVLVIVLVSFSVDGAWTTQVLPPEYTLDNYLRIFAEPQSLLPISVSVQTALLATLAAIVIGAAASWVVARWKGPGRGVLDVIIMLPWALPGTVIGVNLVTAFNEPGVGNLGLTLVGTLWILPVAYFVRFVPLVFRSTSASLEQLDPSLEEAARNLGAGPLRVLRTVTLPLVLRGVLAGALLAFVDGVGEYVASVVIYPPGLPPMSVEIYNRIYSSEFGTAAAYGALQIVLILVVLAVSNRLGQGPRQKRSPAVIPAA
ncbi:iron(III) transport system permease protein [Saccharopolyspora shandongensis]|uniref:Iron(III) transport system permease protein n=1 Tax=Saccharopolyspora shandongensis TaxID=418495 RepID=A0A1H3CUW8_9PSEU|nr:iron ABC transporter permease [Saccharopolyspora shandongensis]SDX57876.1 iron(III) transport system permease protein [Saccharopolyspora shandongensis]